MSGVRRASAHRVKEKSLRAPSRASSAWYEPYGEVTSTGSSDNPYQYTGRENDGTGLYYYRARYYSPALKRFISEDPKGLSAGLNEYSYTHDNPVQRRDPSGLDDTVCMYDPASCGMNTEPVVCNFQLGVNATGVNGTFAGQAEWGVAGDSTPNLCFYAKVCSSSPGYNFGKFAGAGGAFSFGNGSIEPNANSTTVIISGAGGIAGDAGAGAEFSGDGFSAGRGMGGYGTGAYGAMFLCTTHNYCLNDKPPEPDPSCDCSKK
jgi:RHS repeat-associated protein